MLAAAKALSVLKVVVSPPKAFREEGGLRESLTLSRVRALSKKESVPGEGEGDTSLPRESFKGDC